MEKIFLWNWRQKMSAPKWTSNKIGNAKKSHNETGHAKVVAPKRRASKKNLEFLKPNPLGFYCFFFNFMIWLHILSFTWSLL